MMHGQKNIKLKSLQFQRWCEAETEEKPYPSSHVFSDIIHLFKI